MKTQNLKATAGKTLRGFFIRLILILFIIYSVVSFIKIQIQINQKKEQLELMQSKIAEQQAKIDELNDLLVNGMTDEYIAKIAREYGYGLPNERVYQSTLNS